MLTRRRFVLSSAATTAALVSAGALLESPEILQASSNILPMQQQASGAADWTNDSRWNLDYWRTHNEPIEWPNKARMAYLCSIPFESFDPGQEPTDTRSVSDVFFGGKVGVWRIMEILDRHHIKGSFIFNSLTAVQFPKAVKAIADRGHELIAHFWANNMRENTITVERDRELIRQSFSVLQEIAGKRPIAWVAPGWEVGPKSLDMLVEQEGQTLHANAPNIDDIPFTVTIARKKILVIPHETILNDIAFLRRNFNAPSVYVEYLKRDFDRKYAEGSSSPKLFNFVIHAHIGGRAYMADALDEILGYAKKFPDVWFTTRQAIADWWRQKNYS